mmetsp:Transcript_16995/g.50160  ORF Transcript_16995/g.50160 Transcript_16995/m.50160 type:complete len:353 (-) Transcript_16995:5910-6968(-)
MCRQSNPLTVWQCKHLVVVHDRVHVFDPQSIDIGVKDNPPFFVFLRRLARFTENARQQTILPVARHRIENTIELQDSACFGVQCVPLRHEVKLGLRLSKSLDHNRLTAAGLANHHSCVAGQHNLVQLNDFVDLNGYGLVPIFRERLFDCFVDRWVSNARYIKSGEKICNEPFEQRHVFEDKFWQVHVPECPHEDHVFWKIGIATLECTSHHEYRFQRAKTEIVVILLGQLPLGKAVQNCHLFGKFCSLHEPFREKHNLADLFQVGNNHNDWPEQCLDCFGQFRTTSITRIHSDKNSHTAIKINFGSLKHEACKLHLQSIHHALELRRNYRKHRHINTIELIETPPCATLGKT